MNQAVRIVVAAVSVITLVACSSSSSPGGGTSSSSGSGSGSSSGSSSGSGGGTSACPTAINHSCYGSGIGTPTGESCDDSVGSLVSNSKVCSGNAIYSTSPCSANETGKTLIGSCDFFPGTGEEGVARLYAPSQYTTATYASYCTSLGGKVCD